MGRYNLKPSRVYQTATQILETQTRDAGGGVACIPPWYNTIGSIPPSEMLTRIPSIQHCDKVEKRRIRKPSKMFMPQPVTYEEDKMRKVFYSDHPWELARPRIVLEQDGKDGQKYDWSKIQQPGRQLNAESVIQRQLWLLRNVEGMTSTEAYDIARGEFYALRHEEDVERRVAKEEALSTGAYFGKSTLEIGMELEDQAYEEWKAWATKEIKVFEQQKEAVYTNFDITDDADTTNTPDLDSELVELETVSLPTA